MYDVKYNCPYCEKILTRGVGDREVKSPRMIIYPTCPFCGYKPNTEDVAGADGWNSPQDMVYYIRFGRPRMVERDTRQF